MVVNEDVETENKAITKKTAVKPAIGSRHIRKFMGMLGGNS